jgi:hypothetical protein
MEKIMLMTRTAALTGAALVSLMANPAGATSTFGSLGNFDAVNDTGHVAHGFEIDLEGIHASDVTDTFGGLGRGFSPTVERYGAPTITEYSSSSGFGTRVTYQANLSGAPTSWIGTPTGSYTTPGESCWTGGGSGYGPSTPCDHFGVGLKANPTKTTYNWLVEATPGSSTLTGALSNVLAPTWTVTPQAPSPGNPAPPPVVVAQIQAPPADPFAAEPQFGTALWVKVFSTELDGPVGLPQLVGDNALVQQAAGHTETEWQLLQTDPGNPLSGILDNGGAAAVGAAAEAVLRRYEFYKYIGAYNAVDNQALPSVSDSTPGPGEVGAFIGAQNAALNFGAGVASVPEPATWGMMLLGLGGLGAAMRIKRRKISMVLAIC